ncbi:MAG: alpha/beta fold hydrolase [Pseudomonadota bacterium]
MLHTVSIGTPSDRLPPVVIAHGLFGSARNWGVIAKRLSKDRHVIAVDMRNHGDSPQYDRHTYPSMADDLAQVIAAHGGTVDLVGHSMGGKAAMVCALAHGGIDRLVVADIAPVGYSHTQQGLIDAMQALDLDQIDTRTDADAALAVHVDDPTIRAFLLQSLDVRGKRWRLNLDALTADMDAIIGFPDVAGSFDQPTLFLSGAKSDYVLAEHRPKIKTLFPKARFAKLPNAGHWLHAEDPRGFEATLRVFLARQ